MAVITKLFADMLQFKLQKWYLKTELASENRFDALAIGLPLLNKQSKKLSLPDQIFARFFPINSSNGTRRW